MLYPRARVHDYSPKAAAPHGPGTAGWGWNPEEADGWGQCQCNWALPPRPDAPQSQREADGVSPARGKDPTRANARDWGDPAGRRERVGRGMPCRWTTSRAHRGNGPRDGRGARSAGQMPGRRGARGPGAIVRCGPRRKRPGMKPGRHRRPGMKPGRPEGVFIVAPHHDGVFIEVCPPLLIFTAAGTRAPGGTPRSQGSRPCAVGRPRVAIPCARAYTLAPEVLGTSPAGDWDGAHRETGPAPSATPQPAEAAPGRWGSNPPPGNSTVTGDLPAPWGVEGSPPHRS